MLYPRPHGGAAAADARHHPSAAAAATSSSLPDYPPPPLPPQLGHMPGSAMSSSLAPPLLQVPAPPAMSSPGQAQHSPHAGGGFVSPSAYPALTPEREAALRAKGRQLLEEHRRDVAEKGMPYSAEEVAALQERGRELLRTSREAAAANGGQHVPAPVLAHAAALQPSASGRTSTVPAMHAEGLSGKGASHSGALSSSTALSHPNAIASPSGDDTATLAQSPSDPAQLQELLATVQRLQGVVAEQQAQLQAQQHQLQHQHPQAPSTGPSAGTFTAAQMEAAKHKLIREFNAHMARCEEANQTYWAQVTTQHQAELSAVQQECEAYKQRAAEAAAAATDSAALHRTVDQLRADLAASQERCAEADAARLAAQREAAALADASRQHQQALQHLEEQLTASDAQLRATREEAARLSHANNEALEFARRQVGELEADLLNANAELQSAHHDLLTAQDSAAAAAAHSQKFGTAHQRIAELEAALEASRAEVQSTQAELLAARESAAAAPLADDANPFADAEDPFGGPSRAAAPPADDGELDAARQRIAELEAALEASRPELLAAREGAATEVSQRASESDMEAARQYVADLEEALEEAAGDLERLQEDVEEKSRLIQALRAGEAALSSLCVDPTGSGSGNAWVVPNACDAAAATSVVEEWSVSDNPSETIRALRRRVTDLTHELDKMRRQQERPASAAAAAAAAASSTMVPGMEALGRQYAEVEHRLALAEEAKAALESEVRRLRRQGNAAVANDDALGSGGEADFAAAWPSDGDEGEAELGQRLSGGSGIGDEARCPPTRTSDAGRQIPSASTATAPAALADGTPSEGNAAVSELFCGVPPPPPAALLTQPTSASPASSPAELAQASEVFAATESAMSVAMRSMRPQTSWSEAEASGRRDAARAGGGSAAESTTTFADDAGIVVEEDDAGVQEGDDEEDSRHTPQTLSSFNLGRDGQAALDAESGLRPSDGDADVLGDEDVSCRPTASHPHGLPALQRTAAETYDAVFGGADEDVLRVGRGGAGAADEEGVEEEEDATTEEQDVSVSTRVAASRGRRAVEAAAAAHKVEDSGAAMQELGRQYADAQHRLYRSEEARQLLEAEVVELREAVAELQAALTQGQPSASVTALGIGAASHFGEERELACDEDETRTVTTSFASSVPTAARERPAVQPGADGKGLATSPTPASSRSFSDSADVDAFAVAQADADAAAAELTARVAELEAQLARAEAQHEEELQGLVDAAAERIAAAEQQCAEEAAAAAEVALAEAQRVEAELQRDVACAQAQVVQVEAALAECEAAHAAEVLALRDAHAHELQARLAEQEEACEANIQKLVQQHRDQFQLLSEAAEERSEDAANRERLAAAASASTSVTKADAQHWETQHATLQHRFDQLQREYDAFAEDTAALQRRLQEKEAAQQEQQHSRDARDAAAQQLVTLHRRLEEMGRLLEAAQADAQRRADELHSATASHAQTEAALRSELSTLRAQAQAARDELVRVNSLNEELSELLHQGASSVETTLREREAQQSSLEQQVLQLKLQLAAAGDRLTERQAALQEQRTRADDLQRRVVELEEEARAAAAQLREGRRGAEEQERAATHAKERVARDAELARVAAQEAMVRQHATHQQEIAVLHRELDELRNELEVAQTVAATVPLEAQRHQRDLSTVRDRLAEALRSQQELQQQLKTSRAEVERQRQLMTRGNNGLDARDVSASGDTTSASAAAAATPTAADARLNVLLHRSEELEEKLREAAVERDALQQERDRLSMQVKSAARVADVKEQAARRQEVELRSARAQLATVRDDLAQRVQANHALHLDMDHLQERLADLTSAYEELQVTHTAALAQSAMQEHAEALLMAKAVTIPRAIEDYVEGVFSAYHAMLQAAGKDRRYIYDRCDTIEKAAGEAMAEADAQHQAYEAALAEAQAEQQEMQQLIEALQQAVEKADDTRDAAVADAAAAREELDAAQRQTREDVFNAQRDLQVAELQHADTLHSLSLLQDEVSNTAALIKNQKASYERRETELTEEVALLQAELEARKAATRQLQQTSEGDRNELQDLVDAAVQARNEAVREAQALQAQLARALPRLAQLEDEQAQRTADLMDTAQQLSALHKKTSSTEEVSRKHIEELNTTLQQVLQVHAALQRAHTSTEATADRLKTQLADVTEELGRTSLKASQQEEELSSLTARLHEVETRTTRVLADDKARLRDGERRLHGLEQRNSALQQECKSLQEALQSLRVEHEGTTAALQHKTAGAAAQEQQLTHQLRLARERADALEVERQELLSSEQAVTAARDADQREVLALTHQLDHVQQHLRDANAHNERLNREMVQLKTDHAAEVDRLREAITEAQKELAKCRQLLAQAEAHEVEHESTQYSLTTELSAVREELKAARAQAECAHQQYRKEKTEREEMALLLQSQLAQLYEELRSKQEQLRGLENTSAAQLDTITGLRQELADTEERLRGTRQDLLNQQEAAAAAKEHHRRDRYELQSKLNDAEDAVAELTRSQEQYRQRMTSKVELYEVAEQALRGEVTDLRADVARLEEALVATTQGKETAETHQSRQAQSIKAAESEVHALRAQAAHDMTDITTLKVQLQQRTAELERCRREAAAQLTAERLRWEGEHAAACDALAEALRQARQDTKDARVARERALAVLERKQRDVVAVEDEARVTRAQARQLQRRLDAAQYQLSSLEKMAQDTAADLGLTPEDLLAEAGGAESLALTTATAAGLATSPSPHDTSMESNESVASVTAAAAASGAAVQCVMDELQRRLSAFTFAANTLDSEDGRLAALRRALEQQEDAVQILVDAAAGDGLPFASNVTPRRAGRSSAAAAAAAVTPGLISTPTPRGTGADVAGGVHSAGPSPQHLRAGLTPAQRVFVQQISQASATYVHRVEEHLRTCEQMLRAVMMAIGTHELAASAPAPGVAPRPSTAALSSRHKLQVAATEAELHRRTAALTRAVERAVEAMAQGTSAVVERSTTSAAGGTLQGQLQELRRLFSEAERYALLPFNELLCANDAAAERGGHGNVSPPPPATSFTSAAGAAAPPSERGRAAPAAPSTQPAQLTTPSDTRRTSRVQMTVAALSPITPEGPRQWF